jgi:hypothetical protein
MFLQAATDITVAAFLLLNFSGSEAASRRFSAVSQTDLTTH